MSRKIIVIALAALAAATIAAVRFLTGGHTTTHDSVPGSNSYMISHGSRSARIYGHYSWANGPLMSDNELNLLDRIFVEVLQAYAESIVELTYQSPRMTGDLFALVEILEANFRQRTKAAHLNDDNGRTFYLQIDYETGFVVEPRHLGVA